MTSIIIGLVLLGLGIWLVYLRKKISWALSGVGPGESLSYEKYLGKKIVSYLFAVGGYGSLLAGIAFILGGLPPIIGVLGFFTIATLLEILVRKKD